MTSDGSIEGIDDDGAGIYESVVETMADGVFVVDPDGTITFVNEAIESFVGIDRETLVGGTFEQLAQAGLFDGTAYEQFVSALGAIRGGEESETRTTLETEGGVAVELRLCGRRTDERVAEVVGTVRDVTQRQRAFDSLERQQEAMYRLYRVDIDPDLSVEEKLERALELGCEFLDLPIGFLSSIDGETHRVERIVGTDDFEVGSTRPLDSTYCKYTIESDDPVTIRDAETELGDDDTLYAQSGISCYAGTKVHIGSDLYGTFCFAAADARDRSFSSGEREFVRLLGLWAGHNLERQRFESTLRGLHDVSREMIRADTKRGVARLAVNAVDELFDLPITTCWLYDQASDTLQPLAETATARDVVGETPAFERGESLLWECFETGRIRTLEDRSDGAGYDPSSPLQSEIYLPLGSQGVLVAASTEPRSFENVDTDGFQLLGDLIRDAFIDIEQRETVFQRGEALQQQNERLEEFAHVVAHDLRNPLAGAVGFLEIARETRDDRHFDRIRESHDRMQQLIEDLLDIAKGSRQAATPRELFLDRIVEEAWAHAGSRDATLSIPEDLGRIYADETRLLQLFGNLFRNCVEHAGKDVSVTAGLLDDGEGFYVEDDGPGLPDGAREDIRLLGETVSTNGTGIGLASVTDVVNAHGWELAVPETDGGARFEIRTGDGSLIPPVDGNTNDSGGGK